MKKTTYAASGVDIARGAEALEKVKTQISSTFTPGVLGSVGGFGGLFELPSGYKQPVLVSSTDGVGTKLRVAVMAGKHNTVGEDLINHCVNDIAVMGAKPLYFLDYFGTAQLDKAVFADVISGFVRGCKESNCALIGGETAEMPGIYHGRDYDLCGTIVGIIEKDEIISGENIRSGDILIGIASNGLHTNGYSLARKVLFGPYKAESYIAELGGTLAEILLKPHTCYLDTIQALLPLGVNGFAHITGGGIIGNTRRILQDGQQLSIQWDAWKRPPIFDFIQKTGNVPEEDARQAFNLGIGLVAIMDKTKVDDAQVKIFEKGHRSWLIGQVE